MFGMTEETVKIQAMATLAGTLAKSLRHVADRDELRRMVGMIGNLCDSVRLLCLPGVLPANPEAKR